MLKMKNLIVPILFLWSLVASAQKPEPIYSFARSAKNIIWFEEQAGLWKLEVDKNPQNAYAWYNYYRATRNVNRLSKGSTPFAERLKQEKALVAEMEKVVPKSFEYNLCRYLVEGNNPEFLSYLKKADELGPNRTEHLSDMIAWKEMERDTIQRDKYAIRWHSSEESSPGLMNYNYNVLAGLPKLAILLTAGDNDTYPAWTLQAKGFRRDVLVLNLSLLRIEKYRNKVFEELGIKVRLKDAMLTDSLLVSAIKGAAGNRTVYIALTCGQDVVDKFAAELHLCGLAYRLHSGSWDNLAELQNNIEKRYLLDYLKETFYKDIAETWTRATHKNYIVPFMKLTEHYKLAGKTEEFEKMRDLIQRITKGTELEQEVGNWLNQVKN